MMIAPAASHPLISAHSTDRFNISRAIHARRLQRMAPSLPPPEVRPPPTLPIPAPPIAEEPATAVVRPARWLQRLQHRYELVNKPVNPRQERHELVLDVDDLAVAVVPDSGPPIFPMSHVTAGILVGAGAGLSLWFGLIASIREMRDAWRITGHLKEERQYIDSVMPHVPQNLWDKKQLRTAQAMLHQNRVDANEQTLRFVFSGVLVSLASGAEITGYLAQPYMLGALSKGFAAVAAPLLTVGVPLISLFAAGNAMMQYARWHRAWRDRQFVDVLSAQCPWPRTQFDADAFVHDRLRLIRHQALATALGFTGIAVGAPLTFFGVHWGLAMLIPGVLTVAIANHFESKKVEYTNPLSLKQSLALVTERQICNLMGLAYLEYRELKNLKSERRGHYLIGAHRGRIVKTLAAPLRGLHRLIVRPADNHETSLQTLYRFFGARLQLLKQYWEHEVSVYSKNIAMGDTELIGLLQQAECESNRVDAEMRLWQTEFSDLQNLGPEHATARLCETLIEFELFGAFVLACGDHKELRNLLHMDTRGVTDVNADYVVKAVERAGDEEPLLVEKLFEVAETLFLTTLKDWRHSRAREMADLAVERKRIKYILDNNTFDQEDEASLLSTAAMAGAAYGVAV